jgi:hypothetical protein
LLGIPQVGRRRGEVAERLAGLRPAPETNATEILTAPPGPPGPERPTYHRRLWVAAALALALVLVLAGVVFREQLLPFRAEGHGGKPGEDGGAKVEPPPAAITRANAAKVAQVVDLPRYYWEAVWGPRPGQITLVGQGTAADIRDAQTLALVRTVGEAHRLFHIALKPDGKILAASGDNKRIRLFDLAGDGFVDFEESNIEPPLAFSPDGKWLATGGVGGQAKLWDAATRKLVRTFDTVHTAAEPKNFMVGRLRVVFGPGGRLLAVGNRNAATVVYETETGRRVHELSYAQTHDLCFSPDGKLVATAHPDGVVRLWDVAQGKLLRERPTGAKECVTVDWSPSGDVLVTAGLKGKITLWDPRDLSVLKEMEAPEIVYGARFSPNGLRLVTVGGRASLPPEGKVVVWGIPAGKAKK